MSKKNYGMPQLMPALYLNLLSWFALLFFLFHSLHTVVIFPYLLLTHLSRYGMLFI